jgi:hypothetical protein
MADSRMCMEHAIDNGQIRGGRLRHQAFDIAAFDGGA